MRMLIHMEWRISMSIKAELVDHMGNDLSVVNAARVSFDKESTDFTYRKDIPKGSDEGLVDYLASHGHWTPFSHQVISVRETVPIFVARQRFKHMVGWAYNEVSRRYVSDDPEFFVPDVWRAAPTDGAKQGSSKQRISHLNDTRNIDSAYADHLAQSEKLYTQMISSGVAPEQARMVLPQSMLTSYIVTGSLYAWANAYKQRIDAHAQKEIQDLAVQWDAIIEPLFPETWKVLIK